MENVIKEIKNQLDIYKETDDMILYQPLKINIKDVSSYQYKKLKEDNTYYTMLESNLDLILKDFYQGWIKSERQLIFTHSSCISFVQFILNNKQEIEKIIVICRSSNIQQTYSDIQFFINFAHKVNFIPFSKDVEINMQLNMPHKIKKHWNKTYEKKGVSEI